MSWPILMRLASLMLLRRWSTATVVPNRAAMPDSVSPAFTRYVCAPATAAVGAGVGSVVAAGDASVAEASVLGSASVGSVLSPAVPGSAVASFPAAGAAVPGAVAGVARTATLVRPGV